VVLIADGEEAADSARRKLVRIGVDHVEGWMAAGDWEATGRPVVRTRRGDMAGLAARIEAGDRLAVVDVRQEREWVAGHVPGALHALPHQVVDATRGMPDGTLVAVHCSSGYRSSLAASLLARDSALVPWHI